MLQMIVNNYSKIILGFSCDDDVGAVGEHKFPR